MNLEPPSVCLHCERRPPTTALGLCAACHARRSIRILYVRRSDWTPQWEAHLRRLTERARRRLPLFETDPSEDSGDEPRRSP
jgi:hypothetical protein